MDPLWTCVCDHTLWQYFLGKKHIKHIQGWTGLICNAVTFWVPPQCRINAGLVILRNYTPVEFTIIKSRPMTLSRSQQCRAFSRAVTDKMSLPPLFPVVGGVGSGQWLQMTGALHVCRFMTQSLDIIPYAEVDWSQVSASPVEGNNCHFYSVCSKSAITRRPLDDALPFS